MATPPDMRDRLDEAVGEALEPEALNYQGIRNIIVDAVMRVLEED